MPRRKAGEPDTASFGPDMKWSPEARARRSEAAKKAAATRKANQAAKLGERNPGEGPEIDAFFAKPKYPYIQNSRVARWALSGVSVIAMMRGARYVNWGRNTPLTRLPFNSAALRG